MDPKVEERERERDRDRDRGESPKVGATKILGGKGPPWLWPWVGLTDTPIGLDLCLN